MKSFDSTALTLKLRKAFGWFSAYRSLLFFVILASLYGYIVWRINVLSNAPPSQTDLTSAQPNVPQPKIPSATVKKLQGLQDNSVRVQALFNEARQNPFHE